VARVATNGHRETRPLLAVTYEGDDPILLERIAPLVDAIEITPDAIARSEGKRAYLRTDILDEYAAVAQDVNLIVHGVGLSIGSFDRWNETYLQLLEGLLNRFDILWHSEHLGYTTVAGENIGTMLPLPCNEEALDLIRASFTSAAERLSRGTDLWNPGQLRGRLLGISEYLQLQRPSG